MSASGARTSGPANGSPLITVITVTYNSASTIRRCLTPLAGLPDIEVTVVDNASSDGTAALVAQEFPWVRLLALHENLGFGRACNLAARSSTAPFILFLNPDTIAPPEAIQVLGTFLEERPHGGIAGARLVDLSGRPLQSMGDRIALWRLVLDKPLGVLAKSAGQRGLVRRILGALSAKYRLFDHRERVPWVSGAALCCRRTAWEDLGGFDEAFFLYYEDVDLCLRAAQAGWEVWHIPQVVVQHHSGASLAGDQERQKRFYFASQRHLFRKHRGPVAASLLTAAQALYQGLRLYRALAHDRIGRPLARPPGQQ